MPKNKLQIAVDGKIDYIQNMQLPYGQITTFDRI
jgi:hypothetical protein